MGGSNGGSTGDVTKTQRYAPYIEGWHSEFLTLTNTKTMAVINDSPFVSYVPIDVDDAFFAIGNTISDFSSLYSMFGQFMSGFDVEMLWNEVFEDSMNKPEISSIVMEEMVMVNEEIRKVTLPEFQLMMREINSVSSSSFVIGKAVIENSRVKVLSKISAEAKFQMIPSVQEIFRSSLNMDKKVVTTYAETMKLYYMTKMRVDKINYRFDVEGKLWPLRVMDFERGALGALNKATSYHKDMDPRPRSKLSKALFILSYAANGAAIGGSIVPGWGHLVGAGVGANLGLSQMMMEEGDSLAMSQFKIAFTQTVAINAPGLFEYLFFKWGKPI